MDVHIYSLLTRTFSSTFPYAFSFCLFLLLSCSSRLLRVKLCAACAIQTSCLAFNVDCQSPHFKPFLQALLNWSLRSDVDELGVIHGPTRCFAGLLPRSIWQTWASQRRRSMFSNPSLVLYFYIFDVCTPVSTSSILAKWSHLKANYTELTNLENELEKRKHALSAWPQVF